jgi:nitroreductase
MFVFESRVVFVADAWQKLALSFYSRTVALAHPLVLVPLSTCPSTNEQRTQRAPSGFNLQPTQVVLVEDPATKNAIAERSMLGAGNQHRARDCCAVAVFLSDLEVSKRVPRILELERSTKHRHPNYSALLTLSTRFLLGEGHAATWAKQLATDLVSNPPAPFLRPPRPMPVIDPILAWSYKNTGLLVQSFVLAATSHGLSTCIMEGLDSRHLSRILRFPDERYAVPMVVATGYEYVGEGEGEIDRSRDATATAEEPPTSTPRLPLEEVVFRDSFGVPWRTDDPSHDGDERDDAHGAAAS